MMTSADIHGNSGSVITSAPEIVLILDISIWMRFTTSIVHQQVNHRGDVTSRNWTCFKYYILAASLSLQCLPLETLSVLHRSLQIDIMQKACYFQVFEWLAMMVSSGIFLIVLVDENESFACKVYYTLITDNDCP